MKSASTTINKINGIVLSRFSTNGALPKSKNEYLKPQMERSSSLITPNNKYTNKKNQILNRNNKIIEQISKGQSFNDKKGNLRNDGYQSTIEDEHFRQTNNFPNIQRNSYYNEEESQVFNATVPIRGSYRESTYSTVAIPPRHQVPSRDGQRKQTRKVIINAENITLSHFNKEAQQQVINKSMIEQTQLVNQRYNEQFDGLDLIDIIKETTSEKQQRIDGQIKRYMQKVGLKKKDHFPVFYTIDENGNEVKTSLSNPQTYAKITKQQQPCIIQLQQQPQQQQNQNQNYSQKNNYMNDTKSKKLFNKATISQNTLPNQNENLADIMKICQEFQKTIQTFDKKNYKNAKKNGNDFRKLNNQLKQIDIQNLIIQESDDPALQPYYQHLKEQGRVNELQIKNIFNS